MSILLAIALVGSPTGDADVAAMAARAATLPSADDYHRIVDVCPSLKELAYEAAEARSRGVSKDRMLAGIGQFTGNMTSDVADLTNKFMRAVVDAAYNRAPGYDSSLFSISVERDCAQGAKLPATGPDAEFRNLLDNWHP